MDYSCNPKRWKPLTSPKFKNKKESIGIRHATDGRVRKRFQANPCACHCWGTALAQHRQPHWRLSYWVQNTTQFFSRPKNALLGLTDKKESPLVQHPVSPVLQTPDTSHCLLKPKISISFPLAVSGKAVQSCLKNLQYKKSIPVIVSVTHTKINILDPLEGKAAHSRPKLWLIGHSLHLKWQKRRQSLGQNNASKEEWDLSHPMSLDYLSVTGATWITASDITKRCCSVLKGDVSWL